VTQKPPVWMKILGYLAYISQVIASFVYLLLPWQQGLIWAKFQ